MFVTAEQLAPLFRECDKNHMPKNRTLYIGRGVELNADTLAYVIGEEHTKVKRSPLVKPGEAIIGIDLLGDV